MVFLLLSLSWADQWARKIGPRLLDGSACAGWGLLAGAVWAWAPNTAAAAGLDVLALLLAVFATERMKTYRDQRDKLRAELADDRREVRSDD